MQHDHCEATAPSPCFPTAEPTIPDPMIPAQDAAYQQEKDLKTSYKEWHVSEQASAEKLQAFATKARDLWQRYNAQGRRTGKKGPRGIRAKLKELEIPEKTARKAVKKCFPNFFTLTAAQQAAKAKRKAQAEAKRQAEKAANEHYVSDFVPDGNEVGLPHTDVPKDFGELLAWSEGTVRPLLEQVCQPLDEKHRLSELKRFFTAVAAYVVPAEICYVSVGKRPGPKKIDALSARTQH